jgi:hypothetical protein
LQGTNTRIKQEKKHMNERNNIPLTSTLPLAIADITKTSFNNCLKFQTDDLWFIFRNLKYFCDLLQLMFCNRIHSFRYAILGKVYNRILIFSYKRWWRQLSKKSYWNNIPFFSRNNKLHNNILLNCLITW